RPEPPCRPGSRGLFGSGHVVPGRGEATGDAVDHDHGAAPALPRGPGHGVVVGGEGRPDVVATGHGGRVGEAAGQRVPRRSEVVERGYEGTDRGPDVLEIRRDL